ncbi:hypothetical protein ACET3Z_027037 [Daucus carota]
MMESSDYWTRGVLTCSTLCILIVLQTTAAQEGFSSIQCCADTDFTDSTTNISWATDDKWYPDKLTCQGITQQIENTTLSVKTRVFNSSFATKWCYNLTTRKDQDYLIRSTFRAGDLQKAPQSSIFDVLIDVTSVAQVNSSDDAVVEGIFRTTMDYMNFCLLKEQGDPYLSKLELRPLSSNYLKEKASTVLKLTHRIDVGNTGMAIRYPYDPYDKIWRPQPEDVHSTDVTVSSVLNISIIPTSTVLPPTQVLQTALTHPERLEFLHNDLDTGYYTYNLYIYFFEHNESVQAGDRVFNIYINNEKQQEVDILSVGSNHRTVDLNFKANGVLNLTLAKTNGSQLGPICNAYEILQVRPQHHGTTQEDVNIIMDVKDNLLVHNQDNKVLRSWYGDPCLPLPWNGLFCTSIDGSSVITKLNLSYKNLQGSLPPSILKMPHLRELNMSNNRFTGAVPAFPASSILTSLDLSHNNLMGKVPESLASLRQLTTLSFGCNQNMSRELPGNLNRSKLETDNGTCNRKRSSNTSKGIIIGTVTGGILFVVVAGVFCYCFCKKKVMTRGKFDRGNSMTKNAIYSIRSMDDISIRSINILNFSLENIETATQQYKTLIGEGGFGSVYRGTLTDGQEVAVKVRSATSTQGTREFNNELNLLSAIRHENLVPLLGYCYEKDQQILVYPFMSNGSLQDRLYGEAARRKTLDWPTRLSIALGAARGLTYLHTFSGRCVIHRDVKSSNILMDQSMSAKVADFGFSKYAPQEGDSAASLEVRGTAGYLDPEYYSTQHLTAKSDVFSFGVVLLEIISGREPLNVQRPRNEWSLVEWAKPYIRNSRIDEIVDPSIKGAYHAEAMWRVVEVALHCIETFSAYRPSMVDIVRELEDALIIENNASEYLKSMDSLGGSYRFSIERTIIIPPTPTPTETETSPILSQPAPPQPR